MIEKHGAISVPSEPLLINNFDCFGHGDLGLVRVPNRQAPKGRPLAPNTEAYAVIAPVSVEASLRYAQQSAIAVGNQV